MQNLATGAYYSFYVKAVDYNGLSLESEPAVFAVCLKPTHIDRPNFVSSTETSITLSWTKPDYLGGCPLLGYNIYVHDGQQGSEFVEADPSIKNKPYLTQHTFEGLTEKGNVYRFKLEVINEIGSAFSLETSVVLAAVPSKPSDSPTQDFS